MSYKTRIKIWFKEELPKEVTSYEEATKTFKDYIKLKTEKIFHFEIYNFTDDLDNSINFELYSTRRNHQEWQIQCVLDIIKNKYLKQTYDFDINTEETVEDLCFTMDNLDYELENEDN